MTLQPQTDRQARCPHTRITASGSNSVQDRRTCADCKLCLGMVHYSRTPDDLILQILHHAREHRPHLWDYMDSVPPRFQAQSSAPSPTSAAPGVASGQSGESGSRSGQVPPPPQATTDRKHRVAKVSNAPPVVINVMNSGVQVQEEAKVQEDAHQEGTTMWMQKEP